MLLETIFSSPYFKDKLGQLKNNLKADFPGMAGSSASAIISLLAKEFPSLLIIVAATSQAEILKNEIEFWSGKNVSLFPASDIEEQIGQRLGILARWPGIVVAPVKAVICKTNSQLAKLNISVAAKFTLPFLIENLVEFGYKRFDIVGGRGEFSVRGGIADIFPLDFEHPVRIEFLDDKIESIRVFDAYSQKSINKLTQVNILPAFEKAEVPVFERLPKGMVVVLMEKMELDNVAANFSSPSTFRQIEFSKFLQPGQESPFAAAPTFVNKIEDLPKEALVVSKHAKRISESAIEGSLNGGFVFNGLQVVTDRELFGEEISIKKKKLAAEEGVNAELLADLRPGDFVVHENYGIARYAGLTKLKIESILQEYLLLEFDRGDKLYVPPAMTGLIEKYSGVSDFKPKLSRLGTLTWQKTKTKVKKALKDMTNELIQLYSARQKLPGFSFPRDDMWQKELAATFPFSETQDQQKAIGAVMQDMEDSRPMDRLVCGDVGYGKTEVAMRAAAKAVSAGKQVAILVPTTILAEQHYNNFKNRFKSSPFVIEMLSRFRSKKEQEQVVKSLGWGGVDIVIGTHRLLQKDIKFKDLGLLILDEEQRFGVGHKEKLKKLKKNVDVLTLSATPIPRTLYLSLSGARDLSIINTPPIDRSPIRTYVLPFNEQVIKEAVLRELDRGGQVYFVHNFVETIDGMAAKIKKLVPQARVIVAHGQMPEKNLEKTMLKFLSRQYDVLVCTSIIESGLDISSVNTILIDNADRFGLSQLYQIRGRVGRSPVRAYAYLFYHPQKNITEQALERLKAIQEFTALGSGYKLAMRDLEIRGSGNLLGAQQSGHIMEVGFDLYCELLDQAVKQAKGIEEALPRQVEIDLKVEAYIPDDYINDERQRIAVYHRLNLLTSKEQVEEMKKELKDRFGKIPDALNRLFKIIEIKVKALNSGIRRIKQEGKKYQVEWLSGQRAAKVSLDDVFVADN